MQLSVILVRFWIDLEQIHEVYRNFPILNVIKIFSSDFELLKKKKMARQKNISKPVGACL